MKGFNRDTFFLSFEIGLINYPPLQGLGVSRSGKALRILGVTQSAVEPDGEVKKALPTKFIPAQSCT